MGGVRHCWLVQVQSMSDRKSLLDPVMAKVFSSDEEFQAYGTLATRHLPDFIFAADRDEQDPAKVFPKLRWGGQYVFASESPQLVQEVAKRFEDYGFLLERPQESVKDGWRLWPLLRKSVHFCAARKMLHVPKNGLTDRFTFEVELSVCKETHNGKHVVTKRVPSMEWVLNRFKKRMGLADIPEDELERRAHSLIRNILPIFLTREVNMMNRLQEKLPEHLRKRVPHTVSYEKDDRGLVTLLQVNWLRNGGDGLSQLDFALQSAELLAAVHTKAGVAHLDLRLDNMVITPDGVGFIDFGNSVHDEEDINASPTLSKVFSDLMHTTQVQKALDRAIQSGHVTAPYFRDALFKTDKAVDLFYLVLQFTSPHENPDLRDFIEYKANSSEDYELNRMTHRLFAPDLSQPGKVYTAAHVANAVRKIKRRMETAS